MDTSINKPPVSITMITYNRASLIGEAIQSVRSQTYTNWELIIIDDASTDNTKEVVDSFNDSRIKYFKHSNNQGVSKTRNRSLKEAQGKYIAVLDSDDIWFEPLKLEKQIEFLESHPDYAVLGTQIKILNEDGKIINTEIFPTGDSEIRSGIAFKNRFAHSSVVFRKECIDKIGGYDESLEVWEDYDLILHLGTFYKFGNLPIVTTYHRIHKSKISQGKQMERSKKVIEILKRYKDHYPSFWKGIIRMYIKILILSIFSENFFKSVKAFQKRILPKLGV